MKQDSRASATGAAKAIAPPPSGRSLFQSKNDHYLAVADSSFLPFVVHIDVNLDGDDELYKQRRSTSSSPRTNNKGTSSFSSSSQCSFSARALPLLLLFSRLPTRLSLSGTWIICCPVLCPARLADFDSDLQRTHMTLKKCATVYCVQCTSVYRKLHQLVTLFFPLCFTACNCSIRGL